MEGLKHEVLYTLLMYRCECVKCIIEPDATFYSILTARQPFRLDAALHVCEVIEAISQYNRCPTRIRRETSDLQLTRLMRGL